MGQFSWCCALCDQEVMHGKQPGYQWTTDAVILWPNGDRRSGRYEDGYGEIAGMTLMDESGGWRMVHQRCYDKVRHLSTKDLFASFRKERHASDQGWWPGERRAVLRYGEPDRSELTEDQTYICYGCKRTWQAKWSGGACPFGCERPLTFKQWDELVEPLRYIDYRVGHADGIVICCNTKAARYGGNGPCYHYGKPQQARISKPDGWEEMSELLDDAEPFMVSCPSCKSTEVEIVKLTPATPETV